MKTENRNGLRRGSRAEGFVLSGDSAANMACELAEPRLSSREQSVVVAGEIQRGGKKYCITFYANSFL